MSALPTPKHIPCSGCGGGLVFRKKIHPLIVSLDGRYKPHGSLQKKPILISVKRSPPTAWNKPKAIVVPPRGAVSHGLRERVSRACFSGHFCSSFYHRLFIVWRLAPKKSEQCQAGAGLHFGRVETNMEDTLSFEEERMTMPSRFPVILEVGKTLSNAIRKEKQGTTFINNMIPKNAACSSRIWVRVHVNGLDLHPFGVG